MMSYCVSSAPQTLRERFFGALVSAASWALLCSTFQRIARGSWDLSAWVIGGAIFFLITFFWPHNPPSYVLEVDNDEIRLVCGGSVKRTVGRDRIRFVHEVRGVFGRPRLLISERGMLRTWPLGGISVPRNLPQYDEIKMQVTNWLSSSIPSER